MAKENMMRKVVVEKVTLNIGAGRSADMLEKGFKLLGIISGEKPVKTLAKLRLAAWGLRPGLPIGCKVTVRGKKAEELLKMLVGAKEDGMKKTQFDDEGTISFGIAEYIDIPGVKYEPEIGVIGLQVCVTLGRAGFRIKRRRKQTTKIPKKHRINKEESILFMKQKFEIKFEEEE